MVDATGRHETPDERLDRHWDDLLQELRVAQAGVQILFGFLLAIAFTPVFAGIDDWQRDLYVGTLLAAVLSAVMFIGPVAFHRLVFRQHLRGPLVSAGGRMAVAGLGFLMVAMVGSVLLVVSVVLTDSWAVWITAAVATVFVLVWFVVPVTHRLREQSRRHRP